MMPLFGESRPSGDRSQWLPKKPVAYLSSIFEKPVTKLILLYEKNVEVEVVIFISISISRVAFRKNPNFCFSEFSFETSNIYSKYSN